jgi:hypothetical protein
LIYLVNYLESFYGRPWVSSRFDEDLMDKVVSPTLGRGRASVVGDGVTGGLQLGPFPAPEFARRGGVPREG